MKMKNIKYLLLPLTLICVVFTSCDPQLDDKIALGELPTAASFEITETEEDNTYLLRSTTPGAFINNWKLGDGRVVNGSEVTVTYPLAGTYEVELTIATDGGSAVSDIQTIVVAEDLPISCDTSPLYAMLTGCESRRAWRLVPESGALWVGIIDPPQFFFETTEAAIEERPCAWNDEWIFGIDNQMEYDTKGDIWAEDYMGFPFQCVDESQLSDEIRPWGSGVHGFTINDKTGTPTLTLLGLGAYIGLPKAANGLEVGFPVSSVTYDVTVFEQQADRYFLELQVQVGDPTWRFRLESDL